MIPDGLRLKLINTCNENLKMFMTQWKRFYKSNKPNDNRRSLPKTLLTPATQKLATLPHQPQSGSLKAPTKLPTAFETKCRDFAADLFEKPRNCPGTDRDVSLELDTPPHKTAAEPTKPTDKTEES